MSKTIHSPDSRQIAEQYGIDLDSVTPLPHEHRLEKLSRVLSQTDVPFPIDPSVADDYFKLAQSGTPFGIGSLTEKTVNLAGFTNQQHYDALTLQDHLSWACLVAEQQQQKQEYACREYLEGEQKFEIRGTTIPDYYILNARIYQQTGWQLATVSEIIPAHVFFHCHSQRFFPVTTFMRPLGTDYLEEPDIGHDIAGHVATFTIPQVAQVMNNHGVANDIIHLEKQAKLQQATTPEERKKIEDDATELLLYAGRLYWFTVEFGLVLQDGQLKSFGAGILSSPGETRSSVDSQEPNRIIIDPADDKDLLRLATTDYLISEFQKTYFVLKDFNSLTSLTPERIVNVVETARRLPHHTWREIVPGDQVFNVGRAMTGPNEKYLQLLAGEPKDECLQRAAIRNLKMYQSGLEIRTDREQTFVDAMVPIPEWVQTEFNNRTKNGEFHDFPTR